MDLDGRIRTTAVIGALLGALPIPTGGALTALQVWLVRSIARSRGVELEPTAALALAAPLLARTCGFTAWTEVMKRTGGGALVGMVAGAALGGGLTWLVGVTAGSALRSSGSGTADAR